MSSCPACHLEVEGEWTRCPLCDGPLGGDRVAGPLPPVPLRFSRRRLLRALVLTSLGVVLASFAVQLLITPGVPGLGVLRSVWLAVAALWLVVLMAVRKRRNLAKSTVYLVVLVGLVSVYWDYLLGWSAWSLTYAVPILCASSLLALMIIVRVMRIEVGEHIVYSGLVVLLGLTPLVFLGLGWVSTPLPSAVCGALSVAALVLLQLSRGAETRHELAKRLHL
ncbi:DUF6320 domain-containing protein [Brachybacterium sacelli]|uniref:Zinc ribbon domain-containing protein n=1 Tax=Brachybacterium sacelli TaxID=173364 RepID=A0ABS4X032_9MICO|nr:DUF6320 domain-containing protein [Brachybacterium sacelli]MBP2381736.1 hypothetical protein [Brachybacterium sacelli]